MIHSFESDRMAVFISKLLSLFIYPLTISIMLAGVALFFLIKNKRNMSILFLVLSILIVWILSMPIFSNYISSSLEEEYKYVSVVKSPLADAIVVLGGAMGEANERIFHAARLFVNSKANQVIVVGGTIQWLNSGLPESLIIKQRLIELGVPQQKIITGEHSLNTYENALEAKDILQNLKLNKVLLVTSASHMPRAMAVFKSQGIEAIASPANEAMNKKESSILDWLPYAESLKASTNGIKEFVGYAVYKWRGWIGE